MLVYSLRLITLLVFDRALGRICEPTVNGLTIEDFWVAGTATGPARRMIMGLYECPLRGAQ